MFMSKINRKYFSVTKILNKSMWDLPCPSNLNYFWNFGSTMGAILMIQIMTGFTLTLYYSSFSMESFNSIIMIMKESWNGWLIRLIHLNGASTFFMMMYLHLFRGIIYMSAKNKELWCSGIMMMILLMMISFMGYVLPWGQMSYWAVAVITNLFSIIPLMGSSLVEWIWGSFSVSSPTLMRFYSLHFITPLILLLMVMIHLILLHQSGSSNSTSIPSNIDKISFNPYFSIKDMLFILMSFNVLMFVICYSPYLTLDPLNNIPANPMQTPTHIKPEWYFLTSYAILRSFPNKIMGVMALAFSVTIYLTMLMFSMKFSTKFSFFRSLMFWLYISSFLILQWLGSMPAEEPFMVMSLLWTSMFFSSLILINI